MDWRAWPNWVKFGVIYAIVSYVLGILIQVPLLGLLIYPIRPGFLNQIFRPIYIILMHLRFLNILIGFIVTLVEGFIGGYIVMTLTAKKENFKQHLLLSFILLFAFNNITKFYDEFFLTTTQEGSFAPSFVVGLLPFSIAALIYFIYKIIKIRKLTTA